MTVGWHGTDIGSSRNPPTAVSRSGAPDDDMCYLRFTIYKPSLSAQITPPCRSVALMSTFRLSMLANLEQNNEVSLKISIPKAYFCLDTRFLFWFHRGAIVYL